MTTKMIPGTTRIESTRAPYELGTFQGWGEDGEALVIWDDYPDDTDDTFAWRIHPLGS